MTTKQVIAGLLNFLFWGTGYLYLRRRTGLGLVLLALFILNIISWPVLSPLNVNLEWIFYIGWFLIATISAWDAYDIAESTNGVGKKAKP